MLNTLPLEPVNAEARANRVIVERDRLEERTKATSSDLPNLEKRMAAFEIRRMEAEAQRRIADLRGAPCS